MILTYDKTKPATWINRFIVRRQSQVSIMFVLEINHDHPDRE